MATVIKVDNAVIRLEVVEYNDKWHIESTLILSDKKMETISLDGWKHQSTAINKLPQWIEYQTGIN